MRERFERKGEEGEGEEAPPGRMYFWLRDGVGEERGDGREGVCREGVCRRDGVGEEEEEGVGVVAEGVGERA